MKLIQFVLTVLFIKQCFCNENVEVNIKQGILLGKVEKTLYKNQDYYSFKGIPFAAAPIEELRFQPPEPHNGWEGTLSAFENKPTCMQFNTRSRLREPAGISGSEDCLYINIFTPNMEGKAPVVVFDFNDNFRTGFNGTETYSPDFFMEDGVIVVTISNRLGIFGYLTTEDNVIPGNNGLRDFILGLEWIKNNIERFGGDPAKVTLMGSRGGAAIADLLLYSEKAKGLFSGVILQSGTSMEAIYFFENPKTEAFAIGKFLNLTASNSQELLEGLRDIEAEKILNADIDILINRTEGPATSKFAYAPVVELDAEDKILTYLPENGDIINDVPVLVGFNSREGLDLISQYIIEPRLLSAEAGNNILQIPIRTNFRFDYQSRKYKKANKAVVEYYLEHKYLHANNILEYAVYVGDILQNYPLYLAAEKLAKSLSSSVYFYVFDFRGQFNENSLMLSRHARSSFGNTGATVIDELCYLFVCSRIKKNYEDYIKLPSEQPELKVLKKQVRLWSNFAKYGNPTPNESDPVLKGFKWEPFSKDTDYKYLHITKKLQMKKNPLGDRKRFWDDFLEQYSQEAIDGVVTDEEGDEVNGADEEDYTIKNIVIAEEEQEVVAETVNYEPIKKVVYKENGEIDVDSMVKIVNNEDIDENMIKLGGNDGTLHNKVNESRDEL